MLASEIDNLKKEIVKLKSYHTDTPRAEVCLLYVRLRYEVGTARIGRSLLEDILQCPILSYILLTDMPSFKVKISKRHLHKALFPANKAVPETTPLTQQGDLTITTWNCRGFETGEPYLATEGSALALALRPAQTKSNSSRF
jgi:hypothetical protein